VAVLAGQAMRARQILGIEEPTAEAVDEQTLARSNRAMLVRVMLVGAVFIFVPLAAFWITFKLQGG
jgi:hypothetical protein